MQWSKLKKKVESFFATSVQGRVELRATRYREAHDDEGRGYITFDKNQVWNMCSFSFYLKEDERVGDLLAREDLVPHEAQKIAHEELESEGVYSQYRFYKSLEDYCNTSIDDALESGNVLFRALAMIDGRLGKRRLKSLDLDTEHEMVRKFFKFRCQCEGVLTSI